jgi:hypothetical protein
MPALRRLRLRDGEFEASLGYTVKPSLSKKKKKSILKNNFYDSSI